MATASLPKLPTALFVEVNGFELELVGKPNKAETGIWFEGDGIVPETFELDGDGEPRPAADIEKDITAALSSVTVVFDGTTLNAGEVHISEPRKYGKNHAKAGQVIPSTGGNWTVTHSAVVVITDADEDVHRYTLMVTATYLANKGISVYRKALRTPQGKAREVISGLSFRSA